jgi:UDP-N-acetyl-D-mannosaminuronic acid dehydrogenase
MNKLKVLQEKIISKQVKIAVIGLGYVGLPVACLFADKGFKVVGVDIKEDRVDLINEGQCPIEGYEPGLPELLSEVISKGKLNATIDYDQIQDTDIILIDVETPTDDQHIPQYIALRNACQSIAKVMKDGALVVVESTIAPGTMEKVVRPIIEEQNGRKSNQNFFLGVCPERVMPGKLLANLQKMSRVCGGETPEVSEVMQLLYGQIVQADLDPSDLVTAELTKTAENTYRDVNIAFANELALICQATGADFLKVRELVNKSPGRNVLFAGAGVGGHCIPKDPWLLAYGAKETVDLQLIPAARSVNDSMPFHITKMIEYALAEVGRKLKGSSIAVLGFAYLEESDDIRNSPSEVLVNILRDNGANVAVHDPYVEEFNQSLHDVLFGCDAAVIMVGHKVYREMDLEGVRNQLRSPILIDGRRVVDPKQTTHHGLKYFGIGYGV